MAKLVLGTVLNDGRPHEAVWIEPLDDDESEASPEPFRFRLLTLVDSVDGPAVTATDQAIVLYLQALNVDLADRALALKLMVQIQMEAQEFEKALESARLATRTARGLSASLREKLADTRRDVGAVDWEGAMPEWLTDTLAQLKLQMDRDRQLLDLVAQAAPDPAATEACRLIEHEVKTGSDVWLRLERFLQQAIPVFLEAQQQQRLQPRGLAAAIDLTRDVLEPMLVADDATFTGVMERLVQGTAPPVPPVLWGLGELSDILLRAPVVRPRLDPEVDEPGDLGAAVGDSVPEDIARCVADILRTAALRPARLSELLDAARDRADEVSDSGRLLDVVWGAAHWVFVAGMEGLPEERPVSADLATAVATLTAVTDGIYLDDSRFRGPDLLLATPVAFDAMDLNAERTA